MQSLFFNQLFGDSFIVSTANIIVLILCLYPMVGAFFWFSGSLSYRFLKGHKRDDDWKVLDSQEQPMITIMIPAHNEEVMIEETLTYLLEELNYENYEVLVLDDGSTDRTAEILADLREKYTKLRTLFIKKNQGKAHAFNIGMYFAKGEYILSNDADTIPEPDALMKYMNFFLHEADLNTSAVTANMDVQNRTKIIGKAQTVEFSSIVGVIKRSQTSVNDSMYAYSGANTLYKKDFLIDVGGFRQDRATEDISIAWDHQMIGAVPRFAPNIIFHMNVPESIKELYHQRKRWAQGGTEVWLTNVKKFLRHPIEHRYQMSMFIDSTFSIVWSFFFVFSTIAFFFALILALMIGDYSAAFWSIMMSFIFIAFEITAGFLQLLAALILDHHAAKLKYILFAPLYMLFFWMINPITVMTTFVPAIKTIFGFGSGTWVSPERQSMKKK